jgi:5-(carboxyamino)imidazole ribonucleotide synthase
MSARPILPGAVLGMMGGGQLGRMFVEAARRMGYRVHVYGPTAGDPAMQATDLHTVAPYDDADAVERFARAVEVVTFEFENVPAEATSRAALHAPVRPGGGILATTQDRIREKAFLSGHGFPVTRHVAVAGPDGLDGALAEVGGPAILKTAAWGYDGRGQLSIDGRDGSRAGARELLEAGPGMLEARVDFELECSVVVARGLDGDVRTFGPIRNLHRDHILDVSSAPADLPLEVEREARAIAEGVAEQLELVGVLCVELFGLADGRLLVNELAPRPHNSGHLTIEGCTVSQFEQQVRAVCGLPLGDMTPVAPAAMVNLLGDLWSGGEPAWTEVLASPGVHLHLYGKRHPRLRRKMGHLTALGASATAARETVVAARERLERRREPRGTHAAPLSTGPDSEIIDSSDSRRCGSDERHLQPAVPSH